MLPSNEVVVCDPMLPSNEVVVCDPMLPSNEVVVVITGPWLGFERSFSTQCFNPRKYMR
jgi:hypothetical protein